MGPKSWTVHELLKVTAGYLKEKGIESPRLSAELLLARQLDVSRVDLYLEFDRPLSEGEIAGYRSLIRRRLGREPVQHITGVQEFWSIEFLVGPQVLIPRPETELIVEQVLSLNRERLIPGDQTPGILDLGTGCGALAISLCRELEGARIWASDLSGEALALARVNSRRQGLEQRIEFIQGDLWQPFTDQGLLFDIIVSNPPYIPTGAIGSLAPEVRDHEPVMALDGGPEGMDVIEKIIGEAPDYLAPGGWLLVEMDPEQTSRSLAMIEKDPRYVDGSRIKDYSHRYRVVTAQKRE